MALVTPTHRFSNRAENYVKYRPGYPAAIIPYLEQAGVLQKNAVIADIGSGTGLFSEPLLQEGYRVICIEPNKEMRKAGEARLKKYTNFVSSPESGEHTGLEENSIDLVTVAQAFHWLDPVAARIEFSRILRPDGYAVLAWNIQQEQSEFMKAYLQLKEKYSLEAIPERINEQKITAFFEPGGYRKELFENLQPLDFDGLKGQLLSSSYIPLPDHALYDAMISELVELFVDYNQQGFVQMEFATILYFGKL